MSDLLISEDGKHVYDKAHRQFIPIRVKSYHSGWVSVYIFVDDRMKSFNVVALEAFENAPLEEGETSDHANHDRTDNSITNIRRRHILFQGNHRRPFRVSPVTGVQGVLMIEKEAVLCNLPRVLDRQGRRRHAGWR